MSSPLKETASLLATFMFYANIVNDSILIVFVKMNQMEELKLKSNFHLCFKFSDDICQLRLDFQEFSGFVVGGSGACTDTFAAAGQTGKNPPSICGTNTGYHSKYKGHWACQV